MTLPAPPAAVDGDEFDAVESTVPLVMQSGEADDVDDDDDNGDDHDDDDELAYRSRGSDDNDDDDQEDHDPYTDVSSMSEEEDAARLRGQSGGGRGSVGDGNDNNNNSNNNNSNSGSHHSHSHSSLELNLQSSNEQSTANGVHSPRSGTKARVNFRRSDSTGSADRTGSGSGNGSGNGNGNGNDNDNDDDADNQHRSPRKALECVSANDPHTGSINQPPSSPLGSLSVANSIASNLSPPQQNRMPRFYDSEEEGAGGSLVFVGDEKAFSRTMGSSGGGISPRTAGHHAGLFANRGGGGSSGASYEDGGGSVVRVPTTTTSSSSKGEEGRRRGEQQGAPPPRRRAWSRESNNGDGPPPYHVRKRLGGEDDPPAATANAPTAAGPGDATAGDGRRPPLALPPKQPAQEPGRPPATRYKVAAIPAFRGGGGGGGGNRGRASSDGDDPRAKGGTPPAARSRVASDGDATAPRTSPEKERDGSRGRHAQQQQQAPPRFPPPQSHDVIDPGYGSSSNNNNPPPSPRSGGYHVRVSSMGSMSSLGSDADREPGGGGGGDPAGRSAPRQGDRLPPHPNSGNYYHYEQQQQQQQQYHHQQQQYQQQYHHHQQYQQQQQQHHNAPSNPRDPRRAGPSRPPSVNYDDALAQEIAHFLHGEQVARQESARHPPHPPQYQQHPQQHPRGGWNPPPQMPQPQQGQRGPPPLPPQWNPANSNGPQQISPYGSSQPMGPYGRPAYPPPPQAPPLTPYHPDMRWDRPRERCHSISEDDWEETLGRLNAEEGEGGDAKAEAEYRRGPGGRGRQDQGQRQGGRGQPRDRNRDRDEQRDRQFQQGPHMGRYEQQQQQQQRQYYQHQQDPRMNHYQQQLPPRQGGGNQYDNRRHVQRNSLNGEEGYPDEKSGLLPSGGVRNYEGRAGGADRHEMYQMGMDAGPVWGAGAEGGGQPQQHQQQHQHQKQYGRPNSGRERQNSGLSKKKRTKRRRREKEKRRQQHSSDSDEDDPHRRDRRHGQGGRRRNGGRRRQRSSGVFPTDGSMGESQSQSTRMSGTTAEGASSDPRVKEDGLHRSLASAKLGVCNLPLSFAAISFTIALLGAVWLERARELLPSCKQVSFHSSQCAYPEFPGCYFCDEYNRWYILATRFHAACGYVAGASAMAFFAKATLCWRAFIDEMSSPTTASPSGLIFMTMALSFVGKGDVGEMLVIAASFLHLVLVVWFIYMSMAYGTMSDPSWFANTIGIGLCAVKIWFYYPLSGHFLIAITLIMTFLFYPICLIRVALNEKMSATICWINMMGPAVSLYSLAIIMQPTFQQERPDINHFQTVQRSIYLPSMTCLFALCIIGMISSVHGLVVRWKQIAREEFTPAHAAYSFPLLMHALAVQSYRSALDFFADADQVAPALRTALHVYWVACVIAGTLVALICVVTYLVLLPSWVDLDVRDDAEPPEPNETSISVSQSLTYGESLIQPYVSPTILQANETGILIMSYDCQNGWYGLVRTLRIPAFGFEPMMPRRVFNRERNALKLYMGGQGVIMEGDESRAEGDEEGDDLFFDNEMETAMNAV